MKTNFLSARFVRLSVALAALVLSACSKKSADDPSPASGAGDGTVTWKHNGTTYTSTAYSGAFVEPGDKIIITAGSPDLNNVISLAIVGIKTKGVGTYDLRKGAMFDDVPVAGITLDGGGGKIGTQFQSLFGPNASNGTLVVTQYDKANQKLSGTFSFTGGAIPYGTGTGTQAVSNGTFSFTKFQQ